MKHLDENEIRIRETDTADYYVIGEQVRNDLLTVVEVLTDIPHPNTFNKYDEDALNTMHNWLVEERDFNHKQLIKFFKMFKKFGLQDNIQELANSLHWEFGDYLSKSEMYDIMEERRDNKRKEKLSTLHDKTVQLHVRTCNFNSLFEE